MLPHPHDLPVSAKARIWSSSALVFASATLLVLLIVAIFGAVIAIDRHNREALLQWPERHSQAVVTGIILTPGRSGVWPIFQLTIAGKAERLQSNAQAMVGDTVRISYREDDQGNVYVQSIDGVLHARRR